MSFTNFNVLGRRFLGSAYVIILFTIVVTEKCPDYAHARASSVFSKKAENLSAVAFKTAFVLSETRVRGQFVASPSPSPVIFARVLSFKRSKDMNKMQSQRDEVLQKL